MLAETSMPAQWRLETLGNLAHYVNGRAFKPEDWGETGLPIIRIEQINNPDAECDYFEGVIAPDHVIEDGDLLFSWSATLTALVWTRGPAVLNQHIFKVMPKPGTDRGYLHHLLDHLIERLSGQAHGSTMKHIKKSDLLPYPVHVPPFPEQRCIAEILDAADRAIEETEALISKLMHMKTGLMRDLLTRGLDERGHLRDPNAHPEQFKNSPLGRIPREWNVRALGSVADYINGRALGPHEWGTYGMPIIRIEQINRPEAVSDYFDGTVEARHLIDNGDLLFSWSATLTTLIWDRGPAVLNQHIFKVVPKVGTNLAYLHHLLDYSIEELAEHSHGSTMQHIKKADLLPFSVLMPSVEEQQRIAEILDAHDARIRAEEAYRDKLKLQKKGLMDDLLTGRVRVNAAQEVGA